MAVENSPEIKKSRVELEPKPRSKRAYLFIAAGLGANHGLVGIDRAFRKVTGSPDVMVSNSVLSMDPHNPERHQQQADFIKSRLQAGQEVEVVTHSLGILEFTRAIAIIREQDPHFLDERASLLTMTFTGPSGLEQRFLERTKFLVKYLALAGSVNRAINAATAFPPRNMTSGELTDGMRMVFGREKPQDMSPFADTDGNYEKLPESLQEAVGSIDTKIKELTDGGKRRLARRRLRQRGRILRDELQAVFDGKYVEGNEEPALEVKFGYLLRQPHVRQAIREMFTRSIDTTTRFLLEKGAKLKVVGFEHDRAVERKTLQDFVDRTATDANRGEISYAELMGHSGLVLQAEYYVDAVTRRKNDEVV